MQWSSSERFGIRRKKTKKNGKKGKKIPKSAKEMNSLRIKSDVPRSNSDMDVGAIQLLLGDSEDQMHLLYSFTWCPLILFKGHDKKTRLSFKGPSRTQGPSRSHVTRNRMNSPIFFAPKSQSRLKFANWQIESAKNRFCGKWQTCANF